MTPALVPVAGQLDLKALAAATLGGARALRRTDVGHLGIGARGDAVLLEAPSPTHLVYRPGMDLIAATILGGQALRPARR